MDLEKAREILLFHSRSKKNGHFPVEFTHENQMTNPLCGDHVEIKITINQKSIVDIGFNAKACAICSASTSLMCETVKGHSLDRAQFLSKEFENHILASLDQTWPEYLKPLESFEHLKVNHARRACALLPWVALKSAVKEVV